MSPVQLPPEPAASDPAAQQQQQAHAAVVRAALVAAAVLRAAPLHGVVWRILRVLAVLAYMGVALAVILFIAKVVTG